MKKLLLIGSIVLVLGLLITGFTASLFAHSPDDGGATLENEGAWDAMHEACANGDWEAMTEAADEAHGEDFGHMSHYGEDYYEPHHWGGHMGGGMMGGMH